MAGFYQFNLNEVSKEEVNEKQNHEPFYDMKIPKLLLSFKQGNYSSQKNGNAKAVALLANESLKQQFGHACELLFFW